MKEWHDLIGTSDGGSSVSRAWTGRSIGGLGRSISEAIATDQVTWLSLL